MTRYPSRTSPATPGSQQGSATGLLYYHFKDKQGLYAAGLEQLAEELKAHIRAAAAASVPPQQRALAVLDARFRFVETRPIGYTELLRGAASQPKVSKIFERERNELLTLMIEGLPPEISPTPLVQAALEGWLHFVDGVQLAWLRNGHLDRGSVSGLCGRALVSAVTSALQTEQQLGGKNAAPAG